MGSPRGRVGGLPPGIFEGKMMIYAISFAFLVLEARYSFQFFKCETENSVGVIIDFLSNITLQQHHGLL